MSTTVPSKWAATEVAADAAYRPVSTLAVASCLWVVVSLAALADWSLTALPIVGIALGAWAWQRVRRHSDTLAGRRLERGLTYDKA